MQIDHLLQEFRDGNAVFGKGPLSVVLILTRKAAQMTPPFNPKAFLTPSGGQVSGLSGSAAQAILKKYGIDRMLAEEGGRTSRGSIERMKNYMALLNHLAEKNKLDLAAIETWWIERIKEFFVSQPIKCRADVSKSLRQIIQDLLDAALERQRECHGTMVVGAVLEHLVGAKLSIALPNANIAHKSFSAADASTQAKGDFLIGDTAIHVTVAPAEALARKCHQNLKEGLRPLVVTTRSGVGGIMALAENANIADRIDVLEIGQFLTINIYEWIGFQNQDRSLSLEKIVAEYNKIVEQCETDPSLKISLG